MKKKWIALLLSASLITASAAPAYAAEFSDGTAETDRETTAATDTVFGDAETDSGQNMFSDSGDVLQAEESMPVLNNLTSNAEAAAVEGDMYTINFEGELILDQTQEFVRLLNIEREKLGVPPVQIDQKMMEKAILRAPQVAVYYAHKRPDTGGPVNTYYADSAECASCGHSDAKSFLNSLKSSPPHWEILTDKDFIRFGAAICRTEDKCYFVSCQIGISWGNFEAYTGNYINEKKQFTQNIKDDLRGSLYPGIPVYTPLNVGETNKPKLLMRNKETGNVYKLLSIAPSGYWKAITPNTISVDQDGKVTGVAPGEGIVRYYLNDEFSEFLFEVTGQPKPSVKKPSTPNVTGAASGYVNAKLSWKKSSNTKGYQVYKYNSKTKKYARIKTLSASATSFTEKLGYGKTAQYKVRAYNKASSGKTVYGNFSSVKTVKTSPGTPVLAKVSNSSKGRLKLTWKRPSGTEGYVIYRKTGKNGSYKKIKTVTSAKILSYTNSGLKKGTTYYYKIRAYRKGADKKNIYSPWSKVIGSTCR